MKQSAAFLSLYLKEIGVQTPISSFLHTNNPQHQTTEQPSIVHKAAPPTTTIHPTSTIQTAAARIPIAPMLEVTEPEQVFPLSIDSTPSKKITNLSALQQQCASCQSCALAHSRNQVVFGIGNDSADVVFIGDAPDRDEDEKGEPFVGQSGFLFDRMLDAIGLHRPQVYLLNGVKCRPLHSRDPKPNEFSACEHWLTAQLELLQPRLICLLGRVAAQAVLHTEDSLSALRAKQHSFRGIPTLVLDHPSYLLRSQQHKSRAWKNLLHAKTLLSSLEKSNPHA